MFLNWLLLAI